MSTRLYLLLLPFLVELACTSVGTPAKRPPAPVPPPTPVSTDAQPPTIACPTQAARISGRSKHFSHWTPHLLAIATDAGYNEVVEIPGYCLDRDEVTIGEYSACVSSGACTPENATPLWGYEENTVSLKEPIRHAKQGDIATYQYVPVMYPNEVVTRDAGYRLHLLCPIDANSDDGVVVRGRPTHGRKAQLAMACVTYEDAKQFCKWRGGRLPTAPEWELASRPANIKDEHYMFPWGSDGRRDIAQTMNEIGVDEPVGTHPDDTSPEGVHDLYGNMLEWTDPSPVKPLVDLMARPDWGNICCGCKSTRPTRGHAFVMGRSNIGFNAWSPGLYRDSPAMRCDLCEPKLVVMEHRSPYVGFRCAYELQR